MLLEEAIALAQQKITTREQHCHYERVTNLARVYKAMISGEKMDALLTRFIQRESVEMFEQRVRLTIAITPAVTAALMKPFNKVSRNDRVKKNYDFGTPKRNDIVEKMRKSFYGRQRSKNKGLDYWLKTRYPQLSFVDPNAWVVTEWDAAKSAADILKPRPFEVQSFNAWDWSIVNDEAKWLWAHDTIMYSKLRKTKATEAYKTAAGRGEVESVEGDKFTLYDEDYTVVCTEVDKNYLKFTNYKLADNERIFEDEANKSWYILRATKPNIGFVPAFRVGWVKDPETDSKTCVNGWHEAMPFLMKSIKSVSEMDLTMALHVFPQKMQYVEKCPGVRSEGKVAGNKSCNMGYLGDGSICSTCHGLGRLVVTSAQDAILYPMPELKEDMLDLDKMLVYKGPPIELVQFQKEYIDSLKADCHYAVFGEQKQTKVSGSGVNAPVTATETGKNIEGIMDAIAPYTEKFAEVWMEQIHIFGLLAGTPQTEDVDIVCIFPANPNMKSMEDLLRELKAANEAGAPPYLKAQINREIAELLYEGDSMAELMFEIRDKFYPFKGQTADEVALNMASPYVSTETKILYANFEAIFMEIDLEKPDFWYLSYDEQWKIIEDKVQEYKEEIETGNMPQLDLGTGGDTPNGGGDTTTAGDNGGNDNGGDDAVDDEEPVVVPE